MKRLFFSQSMLDSMQEAGRILVEQGILTMLTEERPAFRLEPAYRLVRALENVPGELAGRILSERELKEMQAEVYADSVIHQEIAYQADPGFIASRTDAAPEQQAEEPPADRAGSADELSQFLLDNLR